MKVVVCLDDQDGMLFNQRRQSRDRAMLEDLLQTVQEADGRLWVDPFSEKLFMPYRETNSFITVEEQGLEKAETSDVCFVEKELLKNHEENIEELIVYRWNRVYPADRYLDIDLRAWTQVSVKEFVGASHERISKEVYRK